MKDFFHSVRLNSDLCQGCINCIKRCPTEAIRVRGGKAYIITERCIDCGECIRTCPHHAKQAIFDPLSVIKDYTYTVALPAPSLYGQFNNLDDLDIVLNALIKFGFDDVFEVSKGAEIVSDCTRRLVTEEKLKYPIISSACPAVVRLISVRFSQLLPNLLPLNAPMEVAAKMAREKAVADTGLLPEEVGIIFISPCAAKNTVVKSPLGLTKSNVDAVVAIREIYPLLLDHMSRQNVPQSLADSGKIGVSWAKSGGESAGTLLDDYLAADGIENVIEVLEALEDEKFHDLRFIELNACPGGCVGGVLTVENPYVARARLNGLRKYLPVSTMHMESVPDWTFMEHPIPQNDVFSLSPDMAVAMEKMQRMEEVLASLPMLDCGSCGAPTCKALAEDVIRGKAPESDCIFKMRDQMKDLIDKMAILNKTSFSPVPTENKHN